MEDIFIIFLFEIEICDQDRFQNQLDFLANTIIYFWNKLPNQSKTTIV